MPRLEITTMMGCPLMCTFCPQDSLKKAYGAANDKKDKGKKYLSVENFRLAVDKLPKHVRIDFSGMSEPWANPDCTAMLRYALEQGRRIAIYTTLYGMSETDSADVVALLRKHKDQVDMVCLHLADANNNMPGWKASQEWLNVFAKFCELGIEKIIPRFELMTMDGSGNLHPDLQRLNIQLGQWSGHSRAGALDDPRAVNQPFFRGAPKNTGVVICGMTPFYDQNVLLPNGDVVLCCMDYNMKHVIGNLFEQDYYDLFRSEAFLNVRQENMTPGFSKCSICKSCNWGFNLDAGENGRWVNAPSPEQASFGQP